ncbi:hypothetical protein [Streptomyces wedmorensis]
MTTSLPRPLHAFDPSELATAAENRRWPKWQTMALLHSLGLPVLNACVIEPGHGAAEVRTAARVLAAAVGTRTLMIRSDGGVEKKQYYRGGNTFLIEEIPSRSSALLSDGRAVILAEPTNRFTNRLTVLARLDRPGRGQRGTFTLEALGPGYDVADLTRGQIPPQVTAQLDDVDFDRFQAPRWNEWQITEDLCPGGEDARRQRRLQRLAAQTLTDSGHLHNHADAPHAEAWLRERGFLHLFGPQPTRELLARRTGRLFEDAFVLARSQPNQNWHCLATAFSVFDKPRTVYWDLVDGERKYAATTPAAPLKERAA